MDIHKLYTKCSRGLGAPSAVVMNGAVFNMILDTGEYSETDAYLITANGIELIEYGQEP